DTIGDTFTLQAVVDDTGDGSGVVTELNELNNAAEPLNVELILVPPITTLEPLTECDLGFNTALYDLTQNEQSLDWESVLSVEYYESLDDLSTGTHEILIPYNYQNISYPQTIYLKLTNSECYEIAQFDLLIEKCPPLVPQGFSPNDDGYNDWFNIQGLYDIFTNHKLLIYNRYGTLIFEGNNDKKWYGRANRGLNNLNKPLPVGTYYYVLYLNSPGYKPLAGWVYLNR
ncbi:MAG: gliding motility-associated C-terminal domain-containing protein, partial [Mangrovimonas sp.]|nr:gliding motility-associated C-terminal domain-containing protein [Mangrovimonas sp.]